MFCWECKFQKYLHIMIDVATRCRWMQHCFYSILRFIINTATYSFVWARKIALTYYWKLRAIFLKLFPHFFYINYKYFRIFLFLISLSVAVLRLDVLPAFHLVHKSICNISLYIILIPTAPLFFYTIASPSVKYNFIISKLSLHLNQ